jgi:hypothetical protein
MSPLISILSAKEFSLEFFEFVMSPLMINLLMH